MKIIAVYHNKGGVGKTTTVVNLAAAFRKQGKRVLVIDLDTQANTTYAVGLAKFLDEKDDDLKDKNVAHFIASRDKNKVEDVARQTSFTLSDIEAIPSHITLMEYENNFTAVEPAKYRIYHKLKEVEDQYDIVLIDTPPSLNLFAKMALITADYLLIPSDLKPFANEGLKNVKVFIDEVNEAKEMVRIPLLQVLGVLPTKVSTNFKFLQATFPLRVEAVKTRYGFPVLDSRIYEREDIAKSLEMTILQGDQEIPNPQSVLDYKPDSVAAAEFETLASEILEKIGM